MGCLIGTTNCIYVTIVTNGDACLCFYEQRNEAIYVKNISHMRSYEMEPAGSDKERELTDAGLG